MLYLVLISFTIILRLYPGYVVREYNLSLDIDQYDDMGDMELLTADLLLSTVRSKYNWNNLFSLLYNLSKDILLS